jgi:protein-tyrosine phosphatase
MDFQSWTKGQKAHSVFLQEEKTEYRGKIRQPKIFVDAEIEYVKPDPRMNVFYMDEDEKKKEHDASEWLISENIEGLIVHNAKMGSAKVGTVSKRLSKDDEVEFDKHHPENNLVVNGGPIPFSRKHKLKKKKQKEVAAVAMEESMGSFGIEEEKGPDYGDSSYGDMTERPKKVKELSDKRKRAMLIKGNSNPADAMRQRLAYNAQMDSYKKKKGVATEDSVDASLLSAYGAVDMRRKKDGEDGDVVPMSEEDAEALQKKLDDEKAERLRELAEKELFMKEAQLVNRRLGDAPMPRYPGTVTRSWRFVKQVAQKRLVEPTEVMPFCWLGNSNTAHDKKKLVDMGITHIINLAAEIDNGFPDLFIYCKIALHDTKDQVMDGVFEHANKFINRCRESGGRILIHCGSGMGRSAAVLMAYFIENEEQLLADAYELVVLARPGIEINRTLLYHLALLEMNKHNVTSVAFHRDWKFYEYTQLKSGSDPAWDQGAVERKKAAGIFFMAVYSKLGVIKKKGIFVKLFEDVMGAFHSAKNNQKLMQQRQAERMQSKARAKTVKEGKD